MKSKLITILLLLCPLSFLSCDDDLKVDNDIDNNFETLWKMVDERYCFFEMKKDSIRDWNELHDEYLQKAHECRSMSQLFYVFGDMLNELKDAHVNLTSSFDVSRYPYKEGFADNFISNVIFSENYLGSDYCLAGGLYYKVLPGNVGYIYYPSFSSAYSTSGLTNVLRYLGNTKGLIIDVRGNTGGYLSNVEPLASRFVDQHTLVGYWQRKTGKAHNAFSEPKALYIDQSEYPCYLNRPIVVLTNRAVFSAANNFVQTMKAIPNVTIMGDKTGGGCGVPASNELPCGWVFRYSSSIYLDADKVCTEWGIEPDVYTSLDLQAAYLHNKDSMIDTACSYIIVKSN